MLPALVGGDSYIPSYCSNHPPSWPLVRYIELRANRTQLLRSFQHLIVPQTHRTMHSSGRKRSSDIVTLRTNASSPACSVVSFKLTEIIVYMFVCICSVTKLATRGQEAAPSSALAHPLFERRASNLKNHVHGRHPPPHLTITILPVTPKARESSTRSPRICLGKNDTWATTQDAPKRGQSHPPPTPLAASFVLQSPACLPAGMDLPMLDTLP